MAFKSIKYDPEGLSPAHADSEFSGVDIDGTHYICEDLSLYAQGVEIEFGVDKSKRTLPDTIYRLVKYYPDSGVSVVTEINAKRNKDLAQKVISAIHDKGIEDWLE